MTPRTHFLKIAALALTSFLLSSCVSTEYASKDIKNKSIGGSGRINHVALSKSNRSNTRIVIDISKQKAYLLVDGSIAATAPISSARPGKYTPRGSYRITERVRSGKISTIYNVAMPYWMRLGGTPFGIHAGYLPGYPASAGCIRLPSNMAKLFFDHTSNGTRVNIYSSWGGN